MKNRKYFFEVLFLCLLLIMQLASCGKGGDDAAPVPTPGTPFITSDLSGTWYLYATNGASVGASPAENIVAGNLRGKLILDSLGQVVLGGSFTRSNNQSASTTGGLFGIDSSGVLSGSATTNLGVNFYVGSGKMDASKNTMFFVLSTNYGEDDLVAAIRLTGGFSSLDLAATWYVFSAGGDYGLITVSNASDGIKATIAEPGGKGFFAIDGNGLLNDTYPATSLVATISGTDLSLKQGMMNYYYKDIMFFVAGTDSSNFDLVTAIRAGGTFTAADLSGTWYINGASSKGTDSTKKATLRGTITFDSSGKVTGGSYTRSDTGGKVSFTGGTVTIDNAGVLSGSATTDTDGTINFASGKMNAAKGKMSLAGSAISSGDKDFLFCIKGN